MITVIHRDRLYVPVEAVDRTELRRLLEIPYQTKAHCSPGCPLANRQGRFCSTCPGRAARIRLWERIETPGGRVMVAMAGGDLRVLDRVVLGKYRVLDQRADPPFRSQLRFTGRLRDGSVVDGRPTADQRGMVRRYVAAMRDGECGGILVAAPRTGKCVLPDTLVRTEAGYHPISAMFLHPDRDVETIGRFGAISAPGGSREVRGLYSREADEVVVVRLQSGATIGGTVVHPIQVLDPDTLDERWVQLGQLTGREQVALALERTDVVPVGHGPTETQARLIGTCLLVGDYARWCSDVLHLDRRALRRAPDLRHLLAGECRVSVDAGGAMMPMDRLPVLRDWARQLLSAGWPAWRAFLERAVIQRHDDAVLVVPDRTVALAAYMHLTGAGAECRLGSVDGRHEVSVDPMSWRDYLEGIRPHPDDRVAVGIESIYREMRPQRVMDLRVPNGSAFHTNGMVSHNTAIGVAISTMRRRRTFITASKIDYLRQFGRRFGEMTNLRQLYRAGERPVVLVDPKGWEDGPAYGVHVLKKWGPDAHRADVVMSSFQQFLDTDNGRHRMEAYLLRRYGQLIADEIQHAAARVFSGLVNRLDTRGKLGLSATVMRKDKTHPVLFRTMGRVVAKSSVTSDVPTVELMETGVGTGRDHKNWNAMTSFLTRLEERNRIICRQVFRDLRSNPLHAVLVTTTRREHVSQLVKMINGHAAFCAQERGESWPTELAMAYQGGSDTNAVLNAASAGRCRVVVGMVRMVSLGLDVARWTHVYLGVVPTSNPYDVYQLINRVCTPYPSDARERQRLRLGNHTKPPPVARLLVDQVSASVYCARRLYKDPDYGLRAGLETSNYFGSVLYRMDPRQRARFESIVADPRSYSAEDAGVKLTLGTTRTGKRRRKSAWVSRRRGGVTRF